MRPSRTTSVLGYGALIASYGILIIAAVVHLITNTIAFLLIGIFVPPIVLILTVGLYRNYIRHKTGTKIR